MIRNTKLPTRCSNHLSSVGQLRQQKKRYTTDIFNRSAKKAQRDRAASLPNSRDFDFLKDEIGQRLVDRLDVATINYIINHLQDILTHKFPVVLDLGSNGGILAKYLQDSRVGVEKLFQMDISEKMLFRDAAMDSDLKVKPIRIVGDEEFLPFPNQSLDLVISNLSLHWVNDLPGAFVQIKNCLKPDGAFIASIFGGTNNLKELKNSFVLAEQERDGGISPHISPVAGVSDIGNLLGAANFALTTGQSLTFESHHTVDTEEVTVRFSDPFTLMRDLQAMGEGNVVKQRRPFVSKETMMAAAAIYKSLYGYEDGSVPATFQIVYLIGWAPHESQQKAKKRGSATVSLKSLGGGGKL